ncbi:hypothetical protein XPA_004208 [Xanthoria parietina]
MARAPKTARLLAAGSTPTLLRQEVKHQSQDWLSLLRPISLRVAHLSQTFLFCCLLHPHVAPARILTSLSTFASSSTTTSSSLPGSATSLHSPSTEEQDGNSVFGHQTVISPCFCRLISVGHPNSFLFSKPEGRAIASVHVG